MFLVLYTELFILKLWITMQTFLCLCVSDFSRFANVFFFRGVCAARPHPSPKRHMATPRASLDLCLGPKRSLQMRPPVLIAPSDQIMAIAVRSKMQDPRFGGGVLPSGTIFVIYNFPLCIQDMSGKHV